MMSYIREFLALKAAPGILETVGYLGHKPEKEISEAMAIIKKIRGITLKEPHKYAVLDLCSGNALIPVIAAHLLPVYETAAIDKKQRDRNWKHTRKFNYITKDIRELKPEDLKVPTIITAAHACKNLAETIIELFNKKYNAYYLVLMPCCIGELNSSFLQFIKRETSNDIAWITKLVSMCKGKVKVSRDNRVLSPKNYIIEASHY